MCMLSKVFDHYNPNEPNQFIPWQQAAPPSLPWTQETFDELKKIIQQLDELDKKLGLEDCQDPKKAEWMKSIETRLSALEKHAITAFTGEYRFLSNFYLCPIEYDCVVYPSVEHAYQAAKTLNLEERKEIFNAHTPGQAKMIGKRVTLRSDWESIKLNLMKKLLWQKFQDENLKSMLQSTGDAELIEGNNWGDYYWGVCNGVGENHLGRLLMEIRKELEE